MTMRLLKFMGVLVVILWAVFFFVPEMFKNQEVIWPENKNGVYEDYLDIPKPLLSNIGPTPISREAYVSIILKHYNSDGERLLSIETIKKALLNPYYWIFYPALYQIRVLNEEELTVLAHKVFATLDIDGDGIYSSGESGRFGEILKFISAIPELCKLPALPEGTKLVSIGIHEGTALSSATIMGQDKVTTAVTVHVEKDSGPLYIVLSNFASVIWQFTGNTQAIHHLALNSFSGVAGISKTKIHFLDSRCVPAFYQPITRKGFLAKAAIKKLLGRVPDAMVGEFESGAISISSASVWLSSFRDPKSMGKLPVPTGFSQNEWTIFLEYFPDGITNIEPNMVVALSPIEPYKKLHEKDDLAKLLQHVFSPY